VNFKEFTQNSINTHRTPAALVKTFHEVDDFIRDSILVSNVPQGLFVIDRSIDYYQGQ